MRVKKQARPRARARVRSGGSARARQSRAARAQEDRGAPSRAYELHARGAALPTRAARVRAPTATATACDCASACASSSPASAAAAAAAVRRRSRGSMAQRYTRVVSAASNAPDSNARVSHTKERAYLADEPANDTTRYRGLYLQIRIRSNEQPRDRAAARRGHLRNDECGETLKGGQRARVGGAHERHELCVERATQPRDHLQVATHNHSICTVQYITIDYYI